MQKLDKFSILVCLVRYSTFTGISKDDCLKFQFFHHFTNPMLCRSFVQFLVVFFLHSWYSLRIQKEKCKYVIRCMDTMWLHSVDCSSFDMNPNELCFFFRDRTFFSTVSLLLHFLCSCYDNNTNANKFFFVCCSSFGDLLYLSMAFSLARTSILLARCLWSAKAPFATRYNLRLNGT